MFNRVGFNAPPAARFAAKQINYDDAYEYNRAKRNCFSVLFNKNKEAVYYRLDEGEMSEIDTVVAEETSGALTGYNPQSWYDYSENLKKLINEKVNQIVNR